MAKSLVKKKRTKKFPAEVMLTYWYDSDTDPSLLRKSQLSHGKRVALYKLHRVGTAKIKATVE